MCQPPQPLHHGRPALYVILEPVGLPSLPPIRDELDAEAESQGSV